ncbi:MAG TPA: hypothetical protein VHU89_16310 [Acidobacteriaceae bacterium]|jgi:hypothetical protein|nr:hypothetical protein [Acidobacteriaceae bacterium]
MQKPIEGALGEDTHGDQVLAEAAAFGGLTVERFGYVLRGGEFGLDEQIS